MPMRETDVDGLLELIGALVAERQRLRASGAQAAELEENRRRLADAQWQFSRALVERHRPRRRRAA
jgi:hypothetical protein